jgi:hypothetical protein
MDTQQVLMFEKVFTLIHEAIKVVVLIKIVDELAKAQDDVVRQNLSMALGSLLNLGPHLNRMNPEFQY